MISEYSILKFLHIIAVVYWLGGEWGVFQTSYNVTNPHLSLDERKRHLETAYRIDILARTGIILLLPLGLHLGNYWGIQPLGGPWLVGMWIITALWLSLTWAAFIKRGTPLGTTLTIWDERVRYVLIPILVAVSLASLITGGPFTAAWYATKVLIYSGLLVIGLGLRYVMRNWFAIFAQLSSGGPKDELESRLTREIKRARLMAYVYWLGIGTNAFLGVTKLF
ncbi:MAG: hypothetical protein KatS3mg060_0683 [Dehalococcoidia bacterium]|nr:MAG: hypothetical protein KatS3mg060_0683 [Dehalococcoidia bacterium]